MPIQEKVVVPKTWRSELLRLGVFGVFSVMSLYLTSRFPGSIITGEIVTLGSWTLSLSLPLFWFLPALVLGSAIFRIYDVRFILDGKGIETRTGILNLNQRVTRVRYEDVRGVEVHQTIIERALGIGQVEIGTAATGTKEIYFQGVAVPEEVQEMVQIERDIRQRKKNKLRAKEVSTMHEATA